VFGQGRRSEEKISDKIIEYNNVNNIVSTQDLFFTESPPQIHYSDYLNRLIYYIQPSNMVIISSLIYIDRIVDKMGNAITECNIHRLLLSSLLIATKFLEDNLDSNSCFACAGGVAVQHLNGLEFKFLDEIEFDLIIENKDLETYCKYLNSLVRKNQEKED